MKYDLEHIDSLTIGVVKDLEINACLNDLRPELQAILDRELKAGNRVRDASRGWPDPGSVFVTLADPFHSKYEAEGSVQYNEPNDPHYWKADYTCGEPAHVLAH